MTGTTVVADDSASDLRAELKRLGQRRVKLQEQEQAVAKEVGRVLKDVVARDFPVAEAARLLHLHRTTIYRVYAPHTS